MRNHMSFFIWKNISLIQRRVIYVERVSSPEERIKRAEEIYYRRRAQGVRVSTTSVNIGNTNKISLGKKMVIQIIVSILIYSLFWALRSYKNVFSENVINNTKAVLSYDINFQNLYNQSREYFGNHFNNIIKTNSDQNDDNKDTDSSEENNSVDGSDNNNSDINSEENVENQSAENNQNEQNSNEVEGGENVGIRRRNK